MDLTVFTDGLAAFVAVILGLVQGLLDAFGAFLSGFGA